MNKKSAKHDETIISSGIPPKPSSTVVPPCCSLGCPSGAPRRAHGVLHGPCAVPAAYGPPCAALPRGAGAVAGQRTQGVELGGEPRFHRAIGDFMKHWGFHRRLKDGTCNLLSYQTIGVFRIEHVDFIVKLSEIWKNRGKINDDLSI